MIDEKKLIEEMNKTFQNGFLNDKNWFMGKCSFMDLFQEIVEQIPKVGEWIPVAELDLDRNQEALIKLDDGFVCSARFLIADYSNHCGFYNKYIGFLQCPQVVEWMPYNAERGGKNE